MPVGRRRFPLQDRHLIPDHPAKSRHSPICRYFCLRTDEASAAIRGLIERITLSPRPKRDQIDVVLYGDLGTIIEWTAAKDRSDRKNRTDTLVSGVSASVVAGAGFEPAIVRCSPVCACHANFCEDGGLSPRVRRRQTLRISRRRTISAQSLIQRIREGSECFGCTMIAKLLLNTQVKSEKSRHCPDLI